MKNLFYAFFLLFNYLNLFAITESDYKNSKEFVNLLDCKSQLITNLLEFEDQDLLQSLFDGTSSLNENEIEKVLAIKVFGYLSVTEAKKDIISMNFDFENVLKKNYSMSSHELENLLFLGIKNKLVNNPELEICNNQAANCHSSCGSYGGSGPGLVFAYGCHAYCSANHLRCKTNAILEAVGDGDGGSLGQ